MSDGSHFNPVPLVPLFWQDAQPLSPPLIPTVTELPAAQAPWPPTGSLLPLPVPVSSNPTDWRSVFPRAELLRGLLHAPQLLLLSRDVHVAIHGNEIAPGAPHLFGEPKNVLQKVWHTMVKLVEDQGPEALRDGLRDRIASAIRKAVGKDKEEKAVFDAVGGIEAFADCLADPSIERTAVKAMLKLRVEEMKSEWMAFYFRLGDISPEMAERIQGIGSVLDVEIRTLDEYWQEYELELAKLRGKDLIGLKTGIKQLDELTLGLRGLTILSAPPGVGKTSLLMQLGLSILREAKDTVFIMLSLDMKIHEIVHRIVCHLAGLPWSVYTRGSTDALSFGKPNVYHNCADQRKIDDAMDMLRTIRNRIVILDRRDLPKEFRATHLRALVERAKGKAKAARALVAVDYLQLLPPPILGLSSRFASNDQGQVQLVQDAMASDDAWWVVSEVRKPRNGQEQESGLAAILGSVRIAYVCDFAASLQDLKQTDILQYDWRGATSAPSSLPVAPHQLEKAHIRPMSLSFDKARDGAMRSEIALGFRWTENRFDEVLRLDDAAIEHAKQQADQRCDLARQTRIEQFLALHPGATSGQIERLGSGIHKNSAGKLLQSLLQELRIVRVKLRADDPPKTKRWSVFASQQHRQCSDAMRAALKSGTPVEDVLPG